MSLVNYTLPFSPTSGLPYYSGAPLGGHTNNAAAVNNLLYGPVGHQQNDPLRGPQDYRNDPYAPPVNYRQRPSKTYLPANGGQSQTTPVMRTYGEGSYGNQQQQQNGQQDQRQQLIQQQQQQQQQQVQVQGRVQVQTSRSYYHTSRSDFSNHKQITTQPSPETEPTQQRTPEWTPTQQIQEPAQTIPPPSVNNRQQIQNQQRTNPQTTDNSGSYPERPPGYTRVQAQPGPVPQTGPGAPKTQVHAVLDYDDDFDDYYDDDDTGDSPQLPGFGGQTIPAVTPIQGPIYLKNGTVPVVPLYSYPVLNNGTYIQIPILWTALSVALGLEIRGEIIRGTPCVKRNHQLFCPTAGNSYPIDRIENFIDENKALMKRMYGDFQMSNEYGPPLQNKKRKRSADAPKSERHKSSNGGKHYDAPPGVPDMEGPPGSGPDPIREASATGDSYFANLRHVRQSFRGSNQGNESGRIDACESKIEIVTPYWASNSAAKIRAIVNTQHFEQAIHQEVCSKVQTNRCAGDCGCEQKYKWHRLLAYDPDNDCKGIFMDWFLFPSCCVCRCNPT